MLVCDRSVTRAHLSRQITGMTLLHCLSEIRESKGCQREGGISKHQLGCCLNTPQWLIMISGVRGKKALSGTELAGAKGQIPQGEISA